MKSSTTKLLTTSQIDLLKRVLLVIFLLLFFLIGVKTLSGGLKMMGGDFAKTLFNLTEMPFVALIAGMLATVLFQSSSVTTSIIVGLVSASTITIGGAVPMIMGANLGTSVTNTLVSLGYIRDTQNFKRAFAAATVHDFFNILTVLILFPLEMMTGFIEKMATVSASFLYGSVSGLKYSSPIKALIKPPTKFIKMISIDTFGKEVAGIVMIILAGIIIILALTLIIKIMKSVIESHTGDVVNQVLSKNSYATILLGAVMTVVVQSSSITTSLLIPMAASGLLSLSAIYPITIGANIGTTATALLAALTGNVAGLSIALVHLFFNLLGTLLFFPNRTLRNIPIQCAEGLASLIDKSKAYGLGYVGMVFFILPVLLIYVTN